MSQELPSLTERGGVEPNELEARARLAKPCAHFLGESVHPVLPECARIPQGTQRFGQVFPVLSTKIILGARMLPLNASETPEPLRGCVPSCVIFYTQAHRKEIPLPESFLIFRVLQRKISLSSNRPTEKNNSIFNFVQKPKRGQINATIR